MRVCTPVSFRMGMAVPDLQHPGFSEIPGSRPNPGVPSRDLPILLLPYHLQKWREIKKTVMRRAMAGMNGPMSGCAPGDGLNSGAGLKGSRGDPRCGVRSGTRVLVQHAHSLGQ